MSVIKVQVPEDVPRVAKRRKLHPRCASPSIRRLARPLPSHAASGSLVGKPIFLRLKDFGWCRGKLVGRVPNRTRKIGGVQVNLIAEFDISTRVHRLTLLSRRASTTPRQAPTTSHGCCSSLVQCQRRRPLPAHRQMNEHAAVSHITRRVDARRLGTSPQDLLVWSCPSQGLGLSS